jgi:hypothetical protein
MSSISKPNVMLKEENGRVNYLEWKRAWETHFQGYGTAGKEVLEDRALRTPEMKPMVGPNIREEQMVNGQVQIVVRAMTAEDRRQIPAKLAAWDAAEEKYIKSKGQLFAGILSTIEKPLCIYIENQPEYDDISRLYNVRSLWKLIKKCISNKGGSQIDLIMQWRALSQGSQTLSDHINEFEKLYENIDTTVHPITARENRVPGRTKIKINEH